MLAGADLLLLLAEARLDAGGGSVGSGFARAARAVLSAAALWASINFLRLGADIVDLALVMPRARHLLKSCTFFVTPFTGI